MAKQDPDVLRISKDSQKNLLSYLQGILTSHRNRSEIREKMEAIDIAYARYKGKSAEEAMEAADCPAGNVFAEDDIVAPIVVSQVDSLVAYLSEVFLSGYPIFPIVSTPKNRKSAEQLETLIDDHSILGGYARQLLLFLRDGAKYNYSALEADWDSIEQFEVLADFIKDSGQSVQKKAKGFTKLRRLDPYNTICDDTVAPGDVAEQGDFAGFIEVISRTKLKRLLNKYTKERAVYNVTQAMDSKMGSSTNNYTVHPDISSYVSAKRPSDGVDWDAYFAGPAGDKKRQRRSGTASDYEIVTLYARIIPDDHGIISPQPNTPQIWKLVFVNGEVLVHAKRIISAFDRLPILFGQPLEDGLGYQTQSAAEGAIPIQEAATTLFNMRFSAARRAVSDRALYDPTMIRPSDINAAVPAPKIPVTVNRLVQGATIADAYRQIPFDMRGTETAFQDANMLVKFSEQLSGINGPQQGQFQRGNKSVQEWQDTMGGSNGRLRLPALCLEHQVFVWLKFIIMLNIFQYGEDALIVSQKTGETLDIKISELRKQVMSFRVADGYTPKSKLASTEMLVQGMTLLMNSPILQQSLGMMLPQMWAHMMSLGGVKGLDEYTPSADPNTPGSNVMLPAQPSVPAQ